MILLRQWNQFGWWHEVVLLILLAVLLGVAEMLVPGFVNWKGQLFLSRHLWEFALLTLGMTLIILTGGIDLSVGSTMGLCAVAARLDVSIGASHRRRRTGLHFDRDNRRFAEWISDRSFSTAFSDRDAGHVRRLPRRCRRSQPGVSCIRNSVPFSRQLARRPGWSVPWPVLPVCAAHDRLREPGWD